MRIDATTSLYCIFGKPVKHSFSPYIHNTAFQALNINSVYLAFEVERIEDAVKSIRTLGIKGASITIPFKTEVINYLDEISEISKLIGAVNTIINENKVIGTNTDCYGFYRALSNVVDITDKKIAIFGAGGSARAGVFSLFYYSNPEKVLLFARNEEKREMLKNEIISSFKRINKDITGRLETCALKEPNILREVDIIVNTTPLGMYPDVNSTILELDEIPENKVVMDIVYNPVETKFLKNAKKKNCRIINGLEMLLYQGIKQFELWTNLKAPENIMREELKRIFIDRS